MPEVEGRVPHDPANGLTARTPGNPCNRGCPGDWPCEERKAQRLTSREIVDYLRSDLYKPVPDDTDSEQEGNLWESPLGWRVWVSYGERGMLGVIYAPDGALHSSTTFASFQWLAADLP